MDGTTQVQTIEDLIQDNQRMRDTLKSVDDYLCTAHLLPHKSLRRKFMRAKVRSTLDATLDPCENMEKGD